MSASRNRLWLTREGERWAPVDKVRCARRFRGHVQTFSRPHARIAKINICPHCKGRDQTSITEFHHPDYGRPFFGTWCCYSCHRRLESGSLKMTWRTTYNYESLVLVVRSRWRKGSVVSLARKSAPF